MPDTKLTEGKNGAVILMFKGYSIIVNKYATHAPNARSPEVCTVAITCHLWKCLNKYLDSANCPTESHYETLASEMLNKEELDQWIAQLIAVSEKKVTDTPAAKNQKKL